MIEIAGHDPGSETEASRGLDKQHREVPAGSPAAIESLRGRLSAFIVAALIADVRRHARAEIFEQGERIRRVAAHEAARPVAYGSGGIGILLERQGAKIRPFIAGILERIENGR